VPGPAIWVCPASSRHSLSPRSRCHVTLLRLEVVLPFHAAAPIVASYPILDTNPNGTTPLLFVIQYQLSMQKTIHVAAAMCTHHQLCSLTHFLTPRDDSVPHPVTPIASPEFSFVDLPVKSIHTLLLTHFPHTIRLFPIMATKFYIHLHMHLVPIPTMLPSARV